MALTIQHLKDLNPSGWEGMIALGRISTYSDQAVLFDDRAPAHSMFVLRRGQIAILKEKAPGTDMRLSLLSENAIFGAGCLFPKHHRSAKACAVGEAEVLELEVADVQRYLEANPGFALHFYQHLCQTQQQIISNLDVELAAAHGRLG